MPGHGLPSDAITNHAFELLNSKNRNIKGLPPSLPQEFITIYQIGGMGNAPICLPSTRTRLTELFTIDT